MDYSNLKWLALTLPLLFIFLFFRSKKRGSTKSEKKLNANITAGLNEPSSLHPVFNPNRCIGSAACVPACPEGNIIGLIHGKAQLINPSKCIGHGACQAACPFDAINLVFGTEKRGIDIPSVRENFETNIPGLFIAGELGGMGLIRNAVTQGSKAIHYITKRVNKSNKLDVVIIGAGPAGFSATLAAHEKNMRYKTLEQDSLGGTVYNFPRGKLVMTAPVVLPIIGSVKIFETTKEKLLLFWQNIEKKTGIKINYKEKMDNIKRTTEGFIVTTSKAEYETNSVLLTIGRRGTPRKLNVVGEDKAKVVYQLKEPEDYQGKHVLVVGGGDSALEAATSLAEIESCNVTISYRNPNFSRAKQKNQVNISQMINSGKITALMSSSVKQITDDQVELVQDESQIIIQNQAVLVCVGGILPTSFLKQLGIEVDTKFGTL
ncbi:Thioredoxin reductase [hydrothermal vent metagenome]|uniref:Thioredoxin reductase n=1 Tax=hydrothermal vent metagenome TaxID=652676 RepID=A0A3B0ZGR7_9ZZZZ